jgi:predicted NBD/HSP70 family sugar kinase
MYVAIDIGGTKTLVATIDDDGAITYKHRFETPKDYAALLDGFRAALDQLPGKQFTAGGVGVPGHIDYQNGISVNSPHVTWGNVPLRDDCAKIFDCPFVIDNDANMAGLSEAMLHKDKPAVLYITVSTGIGTGFIRDQRVDPALLKSEGGHMMLPYKGKLLEWEDFASGRAIYERLGKPAAEITEESDWQEIAHDLALGVFNHVALLQPDLVVIGGSIGTYFDNYGHYLVDELKTYEMPIVPVPPIVQAQRPEEVVLFGCYDAAKQRLAHETAHR